MKIVFFGSPEEAVPFLEACALRHEVAAVVTQPDKPAGRGLELKAPAVKDAALRLGLEVLQPEKPSEIAAALKGLAADLAVVVAYGKFLKPDVLSATGLGCLNVHFSLLPKYRGAAPVEWALIKGEARTGVTLFWIDSGMDSGPVQNQAALDIGPEEDAAGLMRRLVQLGVGQLETALEDIAQGRVRREPQQGEPSLAPKIRPEQARLSFGRPSFELHNWARALTPGAYLALKKAGSEIRVKLIKTAVDAAPGMAPGTILRVEKGRGFLVQCSLGGLWLLEVQPEGKRQLSATDFLNGLRMKPGDRLETS